MSTVTGTLAWELLRCLDCGHEHMRRRRDGQLALPCARCGRDMAALELMLAGGASAPVRAAGAFSVRDVYTALSYAARAVRDRAREITDPIEHAVMDARADAFATAVEMLEALTGPALTAALDEAGLEVNRGELEPVGDEGRLPA